MSNKALEAAKRKGYQAAARGESRSSCPYADKRNSNSGGRGVTFSRAFQRYWHEGYDSYAGSTKTDQATVVRKEPL